MTEAWLQAGLIEMDEDEEVGDTGAVNRFCAEFRINYCKPK